MDSIFLIQVSLGPILMKLESSKMIAVIPCALKIILINFKLWDLILFINRSKYVTVMTVGSWELDSLNPELWNLIWNRWLLISFKLTDISEICPYEILQLHWLSSGSMTMESLIFGTLNSYVDEIEFNDTKFATIGSKTYWLKFDQIIHFSSVPSLFSPG